MTPSALANKRLWRLIAALTLLSAAVLSAGFMSATAGAQDNQRAVGNLQTSSPNPGQLLAAWNAPSQTPTDYRVRWAPTGEDYLSFSETNTSERGSAYPVTTTFTVTNLSPGTEYKLQVRARYNGGEYAGNPWSGPWTGTMTQEVSGNPTSPHDKGPGTEKPNGPNRSDTTGGTISARQDMTTWTTIPANGKAIDGKFYKHVAGTNFLMVWEQRLTETGDPPTCLRGPLQRLRRHRRRGLGQCWRTCPGDV